MYEGLIQKLIDRNVGVSNGTLIPTGGITYCTVESGSFSNTHDGYESTYCCFQTGQTCLSEWYWDTPVNVTSFNILSIFYVLDSCISKIWGRVNSSWVQIWDDEWQPQHAYWDSINVSCDNCTGIRISQTHNIQPSDPCIMEVSIGYETMEGEATIVSITKPDSFTPGVQFYIRPLITNVGGGDTLFVTLTNIDTGAVLDEQEIYVSSGRNWTPYMYVTLTQTTDFHGRIAAGHLEGVTKVVDDTEAFTIPVVIDEGEANIISVTKPSSFTPGVSFQVVPRIRNDGGDDHLFVKLTDTDTGVVLKDYTNPWVTPSGHIWEHVMTLTLTQGTDFHGRIDAGHVE